MTVEKIDYVEKEFQRLLKEFAKRTDEWDDQIAESMEESVESLSESMDDSLNLDEEGNPLFRLRKSIIEEIRSFRDMIERKDGQAAESIKGTMKGFDFEDEVADDLNLWQHYPDSFEVVGDKAEGKTRRKVGDVLATMDDERTIAIEVKAGKNYSDKGDNSLDSQMDQSMAYRSSAGAIAVTTIEAMETKRWQNSIFLDRGKNRFIVAVDRDNQDFTMLRVAYILLRERIIASTKADKVPEKKTIDPSKIREITEDIARDMSSATKMRQILTDIEGRINAIRDEISVYQGKVQNRVDELNALA